jgi:hypothetical protein
VDYDKISLIVKNKVDKNIKNYFVDQYYFNEFDFIDLNLKEFYSKLIKLLPQDSKIIINMSSDLISKAEKIINDLDKNKHDLYYSLNLSTKFIEEYKNESEHIYQLLKIRSCKLYLKTIPQTLEQNKFKKIIRENKFKGLIIETDYDPDLDIRYLENFKKEQENLELIYKSDDLYLTALQNNNSVFSDYAGILTEDFINIWNSYYSGDYQKALSLQEELNEKLNLLQNFNYYKVIKYYYKEKNNLKINKMYSEDIKLTKDNERRLKNIIFG